MLYAVTIEDLYYGNASDPYYNPLARAIGRHHGPKSARVELRGDVAVATLEINGKATQVVLPEKASALLRAVTKNDQPEPMAFETDLGLTLSDHALNAGDLSLQVIVAEDGKGWIAQGIELDYAAGGDSYDDAIRRFGAGLRRTVELAGNDPRKMLRSMRREHWTNLLGDGPVCIKRYEMARAVLGPAGTKLPFARIAYARLMGPTDRGKGESTGEV